MNLSGPQIEHMIECSHAQGGEVVADIVPAHVERDEICLAHTWVSINPMSVVRMIVLTVLNRDVAKSHVRRAFICMIANVANGCFG